MVVKSPSLSFKGWSFKEWLKGNFKTIKEVVKVGVPLVIGWYATGDQALTGIITLGGKLLLDSLEYYVKDHK